MSQPVAVTLDQLAAELKRRERDDPLAEVYTPTDNQLRIHRSRKQVTIAQGANRAGKSTALVAEAILVCLHRTVYAEMPPLPVMVWYVMPSLGMFERVIYPILVKLLPRGVVRSFPLKPHPVLTFTKGSTLHFLSADMRQRRLQGGDVHLAVMDETPEEGPYDELQARTMSSRGRLLLGFLPDQASGWVDKRLVLPYFAGDRRDVEYIEMPIADEATDEPLVPWFTKADIQAFKRKWPDPAVQAARIYGKRIRQAGLVFKAYDPAVHHVRPFALPERWTRWLVCDPEYYRFGVLWFVADEKETYYVTDEFFSREATLRERAQRMAAITDARGPVNPKRPLPVYVDSANPQDVAELNWHFDQLKIPLAALPLPFRKVVSSKFDDSMVLRVHSLLEPDHERPYHQLTCPPNEVLYGAPRLAFFETLYSTWELNGDVQYGSRLFWEMQRLAWGANDLPDKRKADGADLIDCLLYGSNILARSAAEPRRDARMDKLPIEDRILWEKILRHDRHTSLVRG